jgi:hypothetical protein
MRLSMMVLAAAVLLAAPVAAQAAQVSFITEFKTVCLDNQNDLTATEATARARGFVDKKVELPPALGDPVTLIREADGGSLAVLLTRVEGGAGAGPALRFVGCTVSGNELIKADRDLLAGWIAIPSTTSTNHTTYRYRFVDGRKTLVGGDDRALEAALRAGGVYIVDVMDFSDGVSVSLVYVTLKP